jgi:3-oxoacyl-[acyl-carrier-protein] synthase-3
MIGITDIAYYLPTARIDNLQRAEQLDSTPDQVTERIGFRKVARMAPDENTRSIAMEALERLLKKNQIAPFDIDVLVVVTQNPDRNIPHLSAELHGLAKFSTHCACFDLGLGCSGYVYGLSVISAFMQANGLKNGVLITADPYSKIVDPNDKSTALIFGDGASATLLTDTPLYTFGKFSFGTQGREAEKLMCNDGILEMNGRSVFNFAATHIPINIRDVVRANDLTLEMIDAFLIHQGSRYIVDTIADRLPIERQKIPFLAAEYGNTVSSSIPIMLTDLMTQPQNSRVVLSAFGVGFSWASTVIQRKDAI